MERICSPKHGMLLLRQTFQPKNIIIKKKITMFMSYYFTKLAFDKSDWPSSQHIFWLQKIIMKKKNRTESKITKLESALRVTLPHAVNK
jgi:G:T-mismatch repair DNA endonuclease (very short patch repair protein)